MLWRALENVGGEQPADGRRPRLTARRCFCRRRQLCSENNVLRPLPEHLVREALSSCPAEERQVQAKRRVRQAPKAEEGSKGSKGARIKRAKRAAAMPTRLSGRR